MAVRSNKFPAVAALALALTLAACGKEQGAAVLPPLPSLQTFVVPAADATAARGWDGVIDAVHHAELAAQTSGRVAEVRFDVNDRVDEGTVLIRITAFEQDAGTDSARAQLRAAEATLLDAEQTWKRFSALSGQNYVSHAQLDQARAARDAAVAARDAARSQLRLASQQSDYTIVRAPFAGIVARRDVQPGETVAPGRALMSLYAPQDLRIEVSVPQTRADAIRSDARATVVLGDGRRIDPAQVIVFPSADVASHSVNVRVVLPRLDAPPAPGTTAKVVFAADVQRDGTSTTVAVRIPATAVAQRGELSGVYVEQDGRLLLRQVRLGARSGDQVEVISGLAPGDTVAADPVAATQAIATQRQAAKRHD